MDKQTFTTSLHAVCSTDELRPIMMCVHFKNGFAYASDSKMIVKQSLEYHTIIGKECLEDKSIHKDNYEEVMRFDIAECDDNGIACKSVDGRAAYFEFFDRKGDEIPDFEKVLNSGGLKTIDFIGINPKLLAKLSKAMHSPTGDLRLRFQGVDKPILVDTPDIPDQMGLIMPVLINHSLF